MNKAIVTLLMYLGMAMLGIGLPCVGLRYGNVINAIGNMLLITSFILTYRLEIKVSAQFTRADNWLKANMKWVHKFTYFVVVCAIAFIYCSALLFDLQHFWGTAVWMISGVDIGIKIIS